MAFNDHVAYTLMWNIMDYSATTFPVSFVDAQLDKKPAYEPRNEIEEKIWERCESNASVKFSNC